MLSLIFAGVSLMKEKFSGWRVLAGCILCMFMVQGTLQAFAVFLPQIVADTGWSLAMVAQVSTMCSGSAFFASMALGPALRRISARSAMLIGAAFVAIHNCVYCFSQNVYMLWFGAFLGGIAIAWGTMAPCSIIITNWFNKNRSQYIALAVAGSMFGSVLINPLIALLIERFGWRRAYLISGVSVAVCAVLIILLLLRDSPESLGQRPYGQLPEESRAGHGVSAAEAKKSLSYKLLFAGIFLMGFSTNVENYMPAFWQSRGLGSVEASLVLSAYAFAAAVISIVMSRINDRLGGRAYILLSCTCFILPLMAMSFTGVCGSLVLLALCCVPFAAGAKKAVTMVPPLVVAEAFGRRDYSRLIPAFSAVLQLGIASSNLAIGPLADRSYALAFSVMAAINLLGGATVILALLKKPYKTKAAPDRRRNGVKA